MNKQLNRHMKNDKKEAKDIKKLIGNPKIIFVVGGPGLGKAAYCQKLVGEFGYTHISMGAVFQQEMAKVSLVLISNTHVDLFGQHNNINGLLFSHLGQQRRRAHQEDRN